MERYRRPNFHRLLLIVLIGNTQNRTKTIGTQTKPQTKNSGKIKTRNEIVLLQFTRNLISYKHLFITQPVIIIYRGKGKSKRVPCTCNTKIRRAILIGLSFFNNYRSKCTQKVELAYTRKLVSLGLPLSSGSIC